MLYWRLTSTSLLVPAALTLLWSAPLWSQDVRVVVPQKIERIEEEPRRGESASDTLTTSQILRKLSQMEEVHPLSGDPGAAGDLTWDELRSAVATTLTGEVRRSLEPNVPPPTHFTLSGMEPAYFVMDRKVASLYALMPLSYKPEGLWMDCKPRTDLGWVLPSEVIIHMRRLHRNSQYIVDFTLSSTNGAERPYQFKLAATHGDTKSFDIQTQLGDHSHLIVIAEADEE
ncbi:MAG: hypothetical protein R3300_20495, partial [Candidatus Promineifilaceae bacterium]|nr:hypothetical protein [Candidatus Promineifilaceae bacterium]